MAPRCSGSSAGFLPFLYPSLFLTRATARTSRALRVRHHVTEAHEADNSSNKSRLNPDPDDYYNSAFADKAKLNIYGGDGGAGCISFAREAFLPDGPPNGGDGGHGGNIYVQAVYGETSLHKIARRRHIRAERGTNGQGSNRAGRRGEDVIITVPVGTVIREISREDPQYEEDLSRRAARAARKKAIAAAEEANRERKKAAAAAKEEAAVAKELAAAAAKKKAAEAAATEEDDWEDEESEAEEDLEAEEDSKRRTSRRSRWVPPEEEVENPDIDKWVLYPGISSSEKKKIWVPDLPKREKIFAQPPAPINLDLSKPTRQPILLAAGAIGGLGNPHFVSREVPKPLFATKGDKAVSMQIELELKLLADVGLVGLPNAGKSTLTRALTNSRARVGAWAFTTLQPNIGTVVLDSNRGRPIVKSYYRQDPDDTWEGDVDVRQRTRFTLADIPGLIEGAHLDKGLGIAFLRHVERAGVLAFVIDLNAGNAVKALKSLWNEVGLYAQMREEEENDREREARIEDALNSGRHDGTDPVEEFSQNWPIHSEYPSAPENQRGLHIANKPWFVIGTKADLPGTKENFKELREYLTRVTNGDEPHPSGVEGSWIKDCAAIPVSAINGQGVDRIIHWTVGLLDD
ncbi:GTPase of the mitochondrial inner membrane that associates with the large ribosomal subunit [Gnomoniopsis smithogilvyi]|uniref:GTPase of the mitochondrial inner membrane that associates with the large ribosomal subunit n=1 Tax=Gnomoniopsis smithogilvyi TaxID=1191159 RepID=A0A9W8YUH1_9PEZI|nr:GTPase of the mitochondrial inner membrane that associates with the large ribosomal subunit [Gnomoniopsis smithogilvyi]